MKVLIKGRENFHDVIAFSCQTEGAWGAQRIEPVLLVLDRDTRKIIIVKPEDVEKVDK